MPRLIGLRDGFGGLLRRYGALIAAILIGAILRLAYLGNQILLDDEWHALNFVLRQSWEVVWTRHGMGANSIPINIYSWLLWHTVGWSEIKLRLPQIIHGLLALTILPLLVARLWGRKVATWFAFLLAISPPVIFYARQARPFEIVMFWGAFSVLALLIRLQIGREGEKGEGGEGAGREGGGRVWTLISAFCAFVAVYHHLYAAPIVLAPFAVVVILEIFLHLRQVDRERPTQNTLPSREELFVAALVFGGCTASFLLPAVLANPWWNSVMGKDHVTAHTLFGTIELLAGTPYVLGKILFIGTAIYGLVRCARESLLTAAVLVSCVIGFVTAVCISTQDDIHVPIQIVRYGLILFPLTHILVAIGLVRIADRIPWRVIQGALPAIVILALFAAGPLPEIMRQPNNFMNHSAYQYSYQPTDWSTSREREFMPGLVIDRQNVPKFYDQLAARTDVRGVIEYPMMLGDHFNLFYYFQKVHAKPVVIGYRDDVIFPPLSKRNDWISANTPLDYVENRVPISERVSLDFNTLTLLSDTEALGARYHNWALVIHKLNPLRELFGARFPSEPLYYPPAVDLAARWRHVPSWSILHETDSHLVLFIR